MSEEEIIQEIEKLELEEEKEKIVKYLLKVVIEGKKDIIQGKEFYKFKIREKIKELEDNYSEHSEVRIGKCIELLNELLEK